MSRPALRRVRSIVDRRFDRARYDAEHTIESFSGRFRDQTDIDELTRDLRGVVSRTMQPSPRLALAQVIDAPVA